MADGTKHAQCDLVAQMLQKEEAKRAWWLSKTLQDFREQKQQLRSGYECDRWDPDQLQEFPSPLYKSNPNYGLPTMHSLLGKNLDRTLHSRMQQEQFMCYLERQVQEQQEVKEEETRVALLSDQLHLAMDTRAAELARLEESCRVAMRIAMANAKRAKAAKQAQKQRHEHQQRQKANLMEVKNRIKSDPLTKNSQAAQLPQALQRVLPFYLKGKTSKQGATIRKGQEVQRCEKKELHQAEKALDAKWGSQSICLAEEVLELEERERELCAELRRGLGSFNQESAKEQQTQQNYLNSIIYSNQPIAQYYLQFNKSSY